MKLAALIAVVALPLFAAEPPTQHELEIQTQLKTAHSKRKQERAAAKEIYAKIVADGSASAFARSEAQVWFGHLLRYENKPGQAIEAYSKVLLIPGADPHHVSEAHVWLGQIYFTRGDYPAAKREFTVVLTLPAHVVDHIEHAQERLAQINKLPGGA